MSPDPLKDRASTEGGGGVPLLVKTQEPNMDFEFPVSHTFVFSTANLKALQEVLVLSGAPEDQFDTNSFLNSLVQLAFRKKEEMDVVPNIEDHLVDTSELSSGSRLRRVFQVRFTASNRGLLTDLVNSWMLKNPGEDYNINRMLNFIVTKACDFLRNRV